jgi:hypothetical protein
MRWSAPPRVVVSVENPPAKTVKKTEAEPLHTWMAKHANHGHAGPWFDAKVHIYNTWRCTCGGRWQCSDEEREAHPAWCAERKAP